MYNKIITGIMWILLIYEIKIGIDLIKEIKKRGMNIFY